MYIAYTIQADIKNPQFIKSDGNRYWLKLYLFIDMICLVMVVWLLLHMINTLSILSTIMMCLAMGN